jgi:hypothetical protein
MLNPDEESVVPCTVGGHVFAHPMACPPPEQLKREDMVARALQHADPMSSIQHSLSKLSLLLLTLLLTPAAGLAATQQLPTEEEAPSEEQEEYEEEEESVAPQREDRDLGLLDESELAIPRARAPAGTRIAAEAGLGLLTGSAGAILGALGGGFLACGSTLTQCVWGVLLGGELGFAFTGSLGVWWGGSLMGADGNYGSALLGGLAGATVSFLLFLSNNPTLAIIGLGAPLVGSLIGYGFSISPEPETPAVALGGARLRPLLSISPQGSFVGLGGHF